MKPAPFEYHRAYTVAETVDLLGELGEDAKILAGGQSLTPMMNFRLARPSALIDINTVRDLDYIRRDGEDLCVGALTRHRTLETARTTDVQDGYALLPRAARWIGHYPIRSRGTVGGSLAHSDPSAEWCLMARLYDATVILQGPSGLRTVPSADWFTGFLTTVAEPEEILTEVRFSRPRSHGALTEFARRKGDFAIASAGVAFDVSDGAHHHVSIVLGGVASEPLRVPEAEAAAEGAATDPAVWEEVAQIATAHINPSADHHGDATYRGHLVKTLVQRAFDEAMTTGPRP